jgi:uncharacterized protein with gpF-like domain
MQLAQVGTAFSMENPRAQKIMRERVQRFAERINETTWNDLRKSLSVGIRHGDSVSRLAETVRNRMSLRKGQDAYTIARTEVVSSMNQGVVEGFKQSGVVESKQWLTAGDEHVRGSHVAAGSSEPIPLTDKFIVGGAALDGPGDPSGPPEEVINCRCTVLPIIEKSAYESTTGGKFDEDLASQGLPYYDNVKNVPRFKESATLDDAIADMDKYGIELVRAPWSGSIEGHEGIIQLTK